MGTRERILILRLLDKIKGDPAFAKSLGISDLSELKKEKSHDILR